jgi:hypothetical protein
MVEQVQKEMFDDTPVKSSGGKKHKVKQGEWLSRIAKKYRFRDYMIIWNDDRNKTLREKRGSPDILFPEEIIIIPEEDKNKFAVDTGKKNIVNLAKTADTLGIRIDASNIVLQYEGQSDKTNGPNGEVKSTIPIEKNVARIIITGIEGERPRLLIGQLDPHNTISGAQGRLQLLGYYRGEIDGKLTMQTRAAIAKFQIFEDIKPFAGKFGLYDSNTMDQLEDIVHRSSIPITLTTPHQDQYNKPKWGQSNE